MHRVHVMMHDFLSADVVADRFCLEVGLMRGRNAALCHVAGIGGLEPMNVASLVVDDRVMGAGMVVRLRGSRPGRAREQSAEAAKCKCFRNQSVHVEFPSWTLGLSGPSVAHACLDGSGPENVPGGD
jgi:hypothetical protein